MTRVRLFDKQPGDKYIEFHTLPVETADDFTLQPEGLLSLADVWQLSRELHRGEVAGRIRSFAWYLQTVGRRPT
jgi:hypothetical protein